VSGDGRTPPASNSLGAICGSARFGKTVDKVSREERGCNDLSRICRRRLGKTGWLGHVIMPFRSGRDGITGRGTIVGSGGGAARCHGGRAAAARRTVGAASLFAQRQCGGARLALRGRVLRRMGGGPGSPTVDGAAPGWQGAPQCRPRPASRRMRPWPR